MPPPSHKHPTWLDLKVAVAHRMHVNTYPDAGRAPFDPHIPYAEYDGPLADQPNLVYDLVRSALRALAWDPDGMNTAAWNPLRGIVEPGMQVLIKPNWVAASVREGADLSALATHVSVMRPIIDYVARALQGHGAITIGDAPLQSTDWGNLLGLSGMASTLRQLRERLPIPIEVIDFRREITQRDRLGMVVRRETRDTVDFVEVDLGKGSALASLSDDCHRFRVSQYDPRALLRNHNAERNCYMIHRRVLDADVVIGMPKLKVHKKAGITCSLKNLVGTVCGKDWLPHYRIGDTQTNSGDEYATKSHLRSAYGMLADAMEMGGWTKRKAASLAAKGVSGMLRILGNTECTGGNWHGNDTTWRMVHDLNAIICYASRDGKMSHQVQRRVLHVVDGIIGGERNSPLQPTAHPAGVVLVGTNPVAVDAVAATIIGFDTRKTPLLRHAWNVPSAWQIPPEGGRLNDVTTLLDADGNVVACDLDGLTSKLNLHFEPAPGWAGMIERESRGPTTGAQPREGA